MLEHQSGVQRLQPISPLGQIHTSGMCICCRNGWSVFTGTGLLHHHSVDIKLSSHSIGIKGEEIFASLVKTPETSIKVSRVML